MASLFRIYVHSLKKRPIATNLVTAALLMTAGDVMAQVIENAQLEDEFTLHDPSDLEGVPPKRRLHLRSYWSKRPDDDDDDIEEEEGDGDKRGRSDDTGRRNNRAYGSNDDNDNDNRTPRNSAFSSSSATTAILLDRAHSAATDARLSASRALETVDWTRTSSMSVWAVAFYTPAYMFLYTAYDRIFPKKTTFAVTARVLGSVVYSVPVNAVFFLYGTAIHHTLEWIDLWEERREDAREEKELRRREEVVAAAVTGELNDGSEGERKLRKKFEEGIRKLFPPQPPGGLSSPDPPPFDSEMMLSKARLKIEMELVTTVTNSARMWIPINLFNFAVVPAHLRPFGLLFFSVFWNCYLSLVQHRDLPLPEMEEAG